MTYDFYNQEMDSCMTTKLEEKR